MKEISIVELIQVVQGTHIQGDTNWVIEDAIIYNRHPLTRGKSLVLVYRKETIHWEDIAPYTPCVLLVDREVKDVPHHLTNVTIIQVKSMIQAFWSFTTYYRNLFHIPVVAITGTCGKTTTKEMIKHIGEAFYHVHASYSSQNEPRRSFPYLMGMEDNTEMAVFETGLGNIGNIKHQCMIYQPTIGIITNIGAHHLDGCKSLEGYIEAKGEMIEGVREGGLLLINADDTNSKTLSLTSCKGTVQTFGMNQEAHYTAKKVTYAPGGMSFIVETPETSCQAFVPGYGEHQVYNALAALAAIQHMGIALEAAVQRLATFQNMERHLEISTGKKNATIVDDTWTINPTSIEVALDVVATIGEEKNIIVILGDINRLGDYEEEFHHKMGTLVAHHPAKTLITIGKKAKNIALQAERDGFKGTIYTFANGKGVEEVLLPMLDENTLVLVKGPMSSRAMIALAQQLKEHS
ncbi:UDP-N-acetylmuramoyl-tripeptide--D-alanyl-D-alanine ligase [Pontibacillus salicampi]|uniref:UDP-N-acetylmuramoyl-tripeptide--D-alanyl-D-alanine ligase n=1 Tax=Pontibacillus salicampi TaxID=1449801 RepID=A0ABV6LLL8_9BACI